jgi:hypothetical protein
LKAKIEPAEVAFAEDEFELNLIESALLNQTQLVQEALGSLKADIERTQRMIAPTVEKALNDALKPYLGAPPPNGTPQNPMIPSAGGGILNMVEPVMKLLGIGNQSNALDSQLQEMFQYQFKRTTLGLWSQAFKDINKKMGLPEHLDITSEGMHLSGT